MDAIVDQGNNTGQRPAGRLRQVARRVSVAAKERRGVDLPGWVWAVGGVLVALALAGLVWGAVQHFRVGRWTAIMQAAKARIVALEAEKATGEYKGLTQATTRAVGVLRGQEQQIQGREGKMRKELSERISKIEQMTPEQLREAFRNEGF